LLELQQVGDLIDACGVARRICDERGDLLVQR
jgi:hypothetical protein